MGFPHGGSVGADNGPVPLGRGTLWVRHALAMRPASRRPDGCMRRYTCVAAAVGLGAQRRCVAR